MASNYYLLNGKNGVGNTVDLPVDGKLKRDFKDIASLDLKTMDIPFSSAREVLKEYNEGIDLDGTFYDAKYPYKKVETKTFAPVFKYDDKYKYYMDNLKYFAEQRDWKVQNNKKVELDKNSTLSNYKEGLLYAIIRYNNMRVIRDDSIIGVGLKDEIHEGIRQTQYRSAEDYIKYKYKLKSILDNYTQLRNLTLEYLSSVSNDKVPGRRSLNSFSKYENYGMEPKERPLNKKSDKQIKYYQLTLDDFGFLND